MEISKIIIRCKKEFDHLHKKDKNYLMSYTNFEMSLIRLR